MGSSANTQALIAARLGYNGEYHEPTSAWQSLGNGHRIYNPVLMRFHSADALSPFEKGGLNAYAYCGDDPINQNDPNGRYHIKVMALGLVFTGTTAAIMAARTLVPPDSIAAKVMSVAAIITGLGAASMGAYYVKVKLLPRQRVTNVPDPEPTAPPLSPSAESTSFTPPRQPPFADETFSLAQPTGSIVPTRRMSAPTTGQGGGGPSAPQQRQRRVGFDDTSSQATSPLATKSQSVRKLSVVTAGPYRKPFGKALGKARKGSKPLNIRKPSLRPYYGGAF